jgi:protein-S-isoprenylcysteine O-methyltransferase Ste14
MNSQAGLRQIGRLLLLELMIAGILFSSAGRLNLPWFWAVLGLHAIFMLAGLVLINPDLLRERTRPGPGGRDRNLRSWLSLLFLVQFIIAGLDVGRYGWSGSMAAVVQGTALAVYVCGMVICIWAMAVNRFFSPVLRIQEERGHHLVTVGPYRYVRHPGYLGILLSACAGVALGSWWSLIALVPVAILILRRTTLEDRLLRKSLEGYANYSERVRYRLVPGVW